MHGTYRHALRANSATSTCSLIREVYWDTMITWTRRAAALAMFSAGSSYTHLTFETQTSTSLSVSKDALILGGFLLPVSAYDLYADKLTALGFSVTSLSYNDPSIEENPFVYRQKDQASTPPKLLLGHSKGAKTIASWMPYMDQFPPTCILIEPVDVNPPGSTSPSRVLESWSSHLSTISKIPTLIISAPYTETSKRYGRAANLCAPSGKDARAFYDLARQARKEYPEGAAPLGFAEFERLGHNDVVANGDRSQIGGCANGPDRSNGALLVGQSIVEWLDLTELDTIANSNQRNRVVTR